MRHLRLPVSLLLALAAAVAQAALPPVPVPPENPLTDAKRVLGKILFWDEQLSSDDTVACGTCHRPASGGADPREGLNPGRLPGSADDVHGSPGIRRLDAAGRPVTDPVFGDAPQVTPRIAPSVFGALWAPALFWDGRAGGALEDPESEQIVIAAGAALENQALMTLSNSAEMAKAGRTWDELGHKLESAMPLALADRWPADVTGAIAAHGDYPALFAAAFGDGRITAVRIAMAIATYERTLVADQTDWDRFEAGDESALDPVARFGWQAFNQLNCTRCHAPPEFTTNGFANTGVRRSELDRGRALVTHDAEDAGAMKIPSLRNVGLRSRFMHTGEFAALGDAIDFYRKPVTLPDVDEIPGVGPYAFNMSLTTVADIQAFLVNALTDPRVAAEIFPFDRPRLGSERAEP